MIDSNAPGLALDLGVGYPHLIRVVFTGGSLWAERGLSLENSVK